MAIGPWNQITFLTTGHVGRRRSASWTILYFLSNTAAENFGRMRGTIDNDALRRLKFEKAICG